MFCDIVDGINSIEEEDQLHELIILLEKWQSRGINVGVALQAAKQRLENIKNPE